MNIRQYDVVVVKMPSGERWGVALQNDLANAYSNTAVVAFFLKAIRYYPHTLIIEPTSKNGLSETRCLDLLQVATVPHQQILRVPGSLEAQDRYNVREKIGIAFDLEELLT